MLNREVMSSERNGQNDISFGPFRIDRSGRGLTRDGVPLPVGGRAFDVLVVLAAAAGKTVSKEALLDQVWPGLTVEENNLQVHISALRKALGEAWIVTVPGRGYRLVVPAAAEPPPRDETLAGKPSIAVLPFVNLSGNAEQEYFSDGVAEDIITELSRNRSLLVIARGSSFTYKGRAVDTRDVARDLGCRYVLAGSVRRDGNRLRIGVQLIDAPSGDHVWAERYDRELTDVFKVQDHITASVVCAISPAINEAERKRATWKPKAKLGAWDAYHRGMWHVSRGGNDDLDLGLEFFRQAVTLDPMFAEAHAILARYYLSEATSGRGPALDEAVALAESEARAALRLDGANAGAHAALALIFNHRDDDVGALEQAERAIALDANDPTGYFVKGRILVHARRTAEARLALDTALCLDPRGETARAALHHLAISFYFDSDYVAAEAASNRVIRAYPDFPQAHVYLAASLGQLGRDNEARDVLRNAISAAPDFFDFLTRGCPPWYRPEDYEHLRDGLRKAGWREQASIAIT